MRVAFIIMFLTVVTSLMAAPASMPIVSFEFAAPQITLHEPVFLRLLIRNTLRESVMLDLGLNKEANLELRIETPNGSSTGPLRHGNAGFGRVGKILLAPDKEYTQVFLVNKWYTFDEPGKYLVVAKIDAQIRTEAGTNLGTPPPQSIELRILERNMVRLSSLVNDLAETVIHGRSYIDRHQAVEALAYIIDPVSVPYLAKVLDQSKLERNEAVEGLARIHTPEAVDLLLTTLRTTSEEDLRSQVVEALRRVANNIKDPSLSEKIRDALRN